MDAQAGPPIDFQQFFAEIKNIAVVGYSDKPERAGFFVAHYMLEQGYQVVGVNPKLVPLHHGIKVYSSLAEIPASIPIDVVDVFRAPPAVPGIAREAATLEPKPRYFFMQPGAQSAEGWQVALDLGMVPIMDACLMAAHKALHA